MTVFHKSVINWLLTKGYHDHEFAVKISDGDKLLWQICENVFEEIKEKVCSEYQLNFTNDVMYALKYGFVHLLACAIRKCFFWLVDVVIIYLILSTPPEVIFMRELPIFNLWKDSLRFGAFLCDKL